MNNQTCLKIRIFFFPHMSTLMLDLYNNFIYILMLLELGVQFGPIVLI